MYLELMNLDNFIKEMKDNKIKEARIAGWFMTMPDQNVGQATQCRIHLTAKVDGNIYRMTEFLGIFATANKEDADKMIAVKASREAELSKALAKEKISVRMGEWKE